MQKTLIRSFARFNNRPKILPESHTNYNFEQYSSYTTRYKKALEQKEMVLKRLETVSAQPKKSQIIKDNNYSTENYQAWRVFDEPALFPKNTQLYKGPDGKLISNPKLLMKTFGSYTLAPGYFPKATGCLLFNDRNGDIFYIHDVQSKLRDLREIKSDFDIAKEFWNSDKEQEFWIACSTYAEKYRFKKYICAQLEACQKGELRSFEERMRETVGDFEFFNDFQKEHALRKVPIVYRHHRSEFEKIMKSKMEFIEDAVYDEKIEKPEMLKSLDGLEKF